ncbi:hypothetical protein BOTBODRAFT_619690 [Botryobasidium botryosum FD-172 SS1]|uniref:Uncharacterized protein n=1 Tax=Botryobasidium botryosum (strain FD-172 SS1) TaxID=930990 RepID=A0A067MQD7_BOTB1|nr:hypothetical protein BOTBODRAFT_619690 [Botryobasidium botryosum FD-172 SS1]
MSASNASLAYDNVEPASPEVSAKGKVEHPPHSTLRSIALVVVCTLGMILNTAGSLALSPNLPRLGQSLHIEDAKLEWIMSSYGLTSALGCGFAQNESSIDLMRGFQGIGSAALIPAAHKMACYILDAALAAATALGATFVIESVVLDPEADKRSSDILALFLLSVHFLAAFIYWEHRVQKNSTRPPLMRLNLWNREQGRFAIMQLIAFLVWAAFTSWVFFVVVSASKISAAQLIAYLRSALLLQLYCQPYLGLTPILAMVRMLPMIVTGLMLNALVYLTTAILPGVVLIS